MPVVCRRMGHTAARWKVTKGDILSPIGLIMQPTAGTHISTAQNDPNGVSVGLSDSETGPALALTEIRTRVCGPKLGVWTGTGPYGQTVSKIRHGTDDEDVHQLALVGWRAPGGY